MIPRPTPTVATWLLKLFCSGPEQESVIGDLIEQYQQGRGRFWYWRQVIAIVFYGHYRDAGPRLLESKGRIRMRQGFALALQIAVTSALLLSAIWPLVLIAVLGGAITGALLLKFHGRSQETLLDAPRTTRTIGPTPKTISREWVGQPDVAARIDSSRISISGGFGAGILILFLLTSVLYELPMLRWLAAPGLLAGLAFAAVLRIWRRIHPRDVEKEWPSITPK